jgi:hypothetical protein
MCEKMSSFLLTEESSVKNTSSFKEAIVEGRKRKVPYPF